MSHSQAEKDTKVIAAKPTTKQPLSIEQAYYLEKARRNHDEDKMIELLEGLDNDADLSQLTFTVYGDKYRLGKDKPSEKQPAVQGNRYIVHHNKLTESTPLYCTTISYAQWAIENNFNRLAKILIERQKALPTVSLHAFAPASQGPKEFFVNSCKAMGAVLMPLEAAFDKPNFATAIFSGAYLIIAAPVMLPLSMGAAISGAVAITEEVAVRCEYYYRKFDGSCKNWPTATCNQAIESAVRANNFEMIAYFLDNYPNATAKVLNSRYASQGLLYDYSFLCHTIRTLVNSGKAEHLQHLLNHHAIKAGVSRLTLDKSFSPNLYDNTLLDIAFTRNDLSTMAILIKAGCNVNHTSNKEDKSLLYRAAEQGNVEAVAMLLVAGASPTSTFKTWFHGNKTPYDVAWTNGHEDVVNIIKQYQDESGFVAKHNAVTSGFDLLCSAKRMLPNRRDDSVSRPLLALK